MGLRAGPGPGPGVRRRAGVPRAGGDVGSGASLPRA